MCLLSFLKSRFDLALSVSTIKFWRCQRRQLRFSSRWPCSRKLATFVQTYERLTTSAALKELETRTFHVLVRESASLRLLKGTKDLFP